MRGLALVCRPPFLALVGEVRAWPEELRLTYVLTAASFEDVDSVFTGPPIR